MQRIIYYIKLVALLCCIGLLPLVFPLLGWILFEQGMVLLWVILGCIYIWKSLKYETIHSEISPQSELAFKHLSQGLLLYGILCSLSFVMLLVVYLAKDLATYHISTISMYFVISLVLSGIMILQAQAVRKGTTWYRFMAPFTTPAFIVFTVYALYSLFYYTNQVPKAQVLSQAERAAQSGRMEECERFFLIRLSLDKNFSSSSSDDNKAFAQRECARMKGE
jgi:hypothetical protein